jgi:hypothetical protein
MIVDHGVFDYMFGSFGCFDDAGAEEEDDVDNKLYVRSSLVG